MSLNTRLIARSGAYIITGLRFYRLSKIHHLQLETISELFSDHNQRYCFRHMYANFNKYYKGTKLRDMVRNAALCYKERHWKVNMDELLKLSPIAATYMMRELPKQWSRAFYDQSTSSEHTNNNFCESFNNMLGPMRYKPICNIGMMYGQLIMGMFYKRRAEDDKLELGQLVPSVLKLIKKMQKCAGHLRVNGAVYGSCIQWQLRGIRFLHGICVLMDMRTNWADYCNNCYLVDALRATYALEMEDSFKMRPPIDIRKPGIPCKKRKRDYDKGHTEKKVRSCTRCKLIGHNKRTCVGAPVGSNPKGKRQRTMVQGGSHSTSYPDPAELSISSRATRGTRGI
ncbi:uncharacterized protein LOC113272714 [Papaver somniferum]|uniref:uncharacterized protein LOC113272714 n=1 Tax=Papaver somniferum TaxID=3469 RepID=UPI000E6F9EDF|nr:uncharacterized protein LOC113272714 [Papaver somniferum]